MFKSLKDSQIQTLQLIKPDVTKKFYQLSAGQDVYATIDLIHGLGSLTRIETVSGSYTVKRNGFFFPHLSIRKEKSDADIASIPLDLQGRSVLVMDGLHCRFVHHSLWKNQWAWISEKNRPIIKFMPISSGQIRGDVELSKDFFYLSQLELLAALGAYFLLQLEDELYLVNEVSIEL